MLPQARQKLIKHEDWLVEVLENVSYFYNVGAPMENLTKFISQQEEILYRLQKQPQKYIGEIVNVTAQIAWVKCNINFKMNKNEIGVCARGIQSIKKLLPSLEKIKDEKQRNKAKIIPYNVIGLLFANVTEKDTAHQNLDSALYYYQKASEFADKAEDWEFKMKTLGNMGTIYGGAFPKTKIPLDHQKAKYLFRESEKNFFRLSKSSQEKYRVTLSNIYYYQTHSYCVEGKLDSALYTVHKSLKMILPHYQDEDIYSIPTIEKAEQILNFRQANKILGYKIGVLIQLYNRDKNIQYAETAYKLFACLEKMRGLTQQQEDYFLTAGNLWGCFIRLYSYLITQYPEEKKAFDNKLFHYQQIVMNMNFSMYMSDKMQNTQSYKKQWQNDATLFYLNKNITQEKNKKQEYEDEKMKILKEKESNQFTNISPKTMSVEEIQKQLDDETVIYTFHLKYDYGAGNHYKYLAAITKDNVSVKTIYVGDWNQLDTLEKGLLRFAFSDINDDAVSYSKNGHKFYKMLFEPLQESFKGKKKMILWIDKKFANVPFSACLTDSVYINTKKDVEWDKFPYFCLQFEKGIINSSSLQHTFTQKNEVAYRYEAASIMPVFDAKDGGNKLVDTNGLEGLDDFKEKMEKGNRKRTFIKENGNICFSHLTYAEKEVYHLDAILAKRKMPHLQYWRKNATEENFIKGWESRISIISTHSFYHHKNVEYSGIALFQPSKAKYQSSQNIYEKMLDGIVYHAEVLVSNLKTDLVILSSCESGFANSQTNGNYSLAQQFFYLGASNVISTLWSIDDEGTSVIMKSFFDFLYANPTPDYDYAWAMQQAISKTIKDKKFAHPKYWAAFQMDLKFKAKTN
ncbi:MAG: CHAT domain-containing protein [Bacteroidetes bacterium]|nr:MAG: CHAT domain-containing protein [Bacteroidota bacterium]